MSPVARAHFDWQLRTRALALGERTLVMGIVNVTPDSFSDGGHHASTQAAVAHALQLLDDGADIIDIGGESTKPGATAGTAAALDALEEQRRVLPVIAGILHVRPDAVLSIDTYRASTAKLAVEAGAEIVNDVSGGLWDEEMLVTCAALRCGAVVMHTRGLPSEWASQQALAADQVVPLVLDGLRERVAAALSAGIARERIVIDPGFGFGKRGAENWALLAGFERLQELGFPMLAGLSRKGFLDPSKTAVERDEATHAAHTVAIRAGAHIVRVHDVRGAMLSASATDRKL
jgi:dihydropteroate synthase